MATSAASSEKKLVWLDCDPGVDDALAIFLAGASPSIDLLGISTVHGNASLEEVTINAVRLLHAAEIRDIPVYAGLSKPLTRPINDHQNFHGEGGVGGVILPDSGHQEAITTDVFHSIYKRITSQLPRKTHLVAVGCLTNVALLLTNYPEIKDSLEAITIMGGAIKIGNQSPSAEFNIRTDPEAAKIVFASGVKLTMCPLDLTRHVRLTADILKQLESLDSEFARCVIKMLQFYQDKYLELYGYDYPPLHDPCAVYYVINPAAFETKYLNVEIETKSEFCDGRTVVDVYGITGRTKNCVVGLKLDQEPFWKDMINAIEVCNARSPLNKPK